MILIITNQKLNIQNDDIKIINTKVEMLSDYELKIESETISFDYLIIEDLSLVTNLNKTGILIDEDIPVVNWVGQTSLDNIYYGDYQTALEDLYENE